MILVDATVIIAYYRSGDARIASQFARLAVAICGITRTEILNGVRSPAERTRTLTILNAFQQVSFPEPLWDIVGDNLALLRSRGILLPLADAAVATLSIHLNAEAWARDRHFQAMQQILPALRLYQESP